MTDPTEMIDRKDASRPAPPAATARAVAPKPAMPVSKSRSSRPAHPSLQIGIASMLVLVIVAALISAGLVYAARIPEIQEEWSVLFGTKVTADRSRRGPQILFILFTVTSPLLIAMTLSLATSFWAFISRRSAR